MLGVRTAGKGGCPPRPLSVSFRPVTPPTRRLLVLLAASLGLGLVGCGADPYPGQPEEGALRVPLIQEMKGFDPTQSDEEISGLCSINVYDTLYEYHHLKRPPCQQEEVTRKTNKTKPI